MDGISDPLGSGTPTPRSEAAKFDAHRSWTSREGPWWVVRLEDAEAMERDLIATQQRLAELQAECAEMHATHNAYTFSSQQRLAAADECAMTWQLRFEAAELEKEEAKAKLVFHGHRSEAAHNAGHLGMPQGDCQCSICRPFYARLAAAERERDAAHLRIAILQGALGHPVLCGTPEPEPDDHLAKNTLARYIAEERDALQRELAEAVKRKDIAEMSRDAAKHALTACSGRCLELQKQIQAHGSEGWIELQKTVSRQHEVISEYRATEEAQKPLREQWAKDCAERDAALAQVHALRIGLTDIRSAVEGYLDGSPDATETNKLANQIDAAAADALSILTP